MLKPEYLLKIVLAVSVVWISLFAMAKPTMAQSSPCARATILIGLLQEHHYAPIALDDSFSRETFHFLIDQLDPYSILFTQTDLESLQRFELMFDDEIKNNSCAFYNALYDVFHLQNQKTKEWLEGVSAGQFNFSEKESLTYYPQESSPVYALNEVALEKRWMKLIKSQVLEIFLTPNRLEEKTDDELVSAFKTEQAALVNKVIQRHLRRIKIRLDENGGLQNYVSSNYLNAIAQQFDPHTNYLSPQEERQHDEYLSREMLSFGLSVSSDEEGNVVIEELVPGGPAWESGKLHEGDVILAIKWSKSGSLDLSYIEPNEISSILAELTTDTIQIETRTQVGERITTMLQKSAIENTDNVLKGFILERNQKVGYIKLPSFYRGEFSQLQPGAYSGGCAADVAREIIKLKESNIHGLVLDLRFNGGGDLFEAIDLIGTFIDYGPATILNSGKQAPEVFKDMKRGSTWSGPLLVMINGASASASELFSAAMQDYNLSIYSYLLPYISNY